MQRRKASLGKVYCAINARGAPNFTLTEAHRVHIFCSGAHAGCRVTRGYLGDTPHEAFTERNFAMLVDIIVARSAYGGDLDRDDIHRHATFYCSIRRLLQKLLRIIAA